MIQQLKNNTIHLILPRSTTSILSFLSVTTGMRTESEDDPDEAINAIKKIK